ncbi:MAG: hypothetical protein RDV41_00895 [Planctomycetota bacterium]|nr:hypothetical protein [Planctomycetota bacterium]
MDIIQPREREEEARTFSKSACSKNKRMRLKIRLIDNEPFQRAGIDLLKEQGGQFFPGTFEVDSCDHHTE